MRKLGLAALVAAAAVLALLFGGWLFLTSGPGERQVAKRVTAALDQALPGSVQFRELDLSGNTVVLKDVVLRDPEGLVVAKVGRLEVTIGLGALLRQEVDLHRVALSQVELDLLQDERGLNLLRALTLAAEESPAAEDPTLTMRIRNLTLEQAQVRFRQKLHPELAEHLEVEGLGGEGELLFRAKDGSAKGELKLLGSLTAPAKGPLDLALSFDHGPERTGAQLQLTFLDLLADLTVSGRSGERLTVVVDRLKAPAPSMRELVPPWPLQAELRAVGELVQEGNDLGANLSLEAGRATIAVKGQLDLLRLRAREVEVRAEGIDLSELVPGGPPSDLALNLSGHGGGTSWESLQGKLELSMPSSQIEGHGFGPIEVSAQAQDGQVEVSQLQVIVPGARLSGAGSGTPSLLSFEGQLVASDLAVLGKTLGRLVQPEGLPIAGKGQLSLKVKGPLEHPGVWAKGRFESLRWEGIRARALELDGGLEDVRRPLDADALIRAGELHLGERSFHQVKAQLSTRGRNVKADLTASGFAEVEVHLEGLADLDRQGILLSSVQVRYPEATWRMERPAHLRFLPDRMSLDELWLASGRQRIGASGSLRGAKIDLRASVENLSLQTLPAAALPKGAVLQGELNLRVHAQGTKRRPTATAQVTLRNGRWNEFRDLGLELEARYADDRAEGRLRALVFASQVEGTFAFPVLGLTRGVNQPLRAQLEVGHTRLEALFAALGVDPGLSGSAAATVHVEGTAADPRVRIVIDGDEIRQREGPPADLDLVVESGPDGKVSARIDLVTLGSRSFLLLKTPFVAGQFLKGPVKGEMFLTTPVQLEGSFVELPLQALTAWGLSSRDLSGKVSLTLDAHGTVRAPEGKVRATVKGASAQGVEPFDAFVSVDALEQEVRVVGTALRGGGPLAELEGEVGTSLGALLAGRHLDRVPLQLDANLGPWRLSELEALRPEDPSALDSAAPDGLVTAKVSLSGTPAQPKVELSGKVERLGVGQVALGRMDFEGQYAAGRALAKVLLTSPTDARMSVDGNAQVELSAPAFRRGISWAQVPVQVRLSANDFDPSFLSGMNLRLRELGGRIDADARITGALGAPLFLGKLAWKDGRLAVLGFGQYRGIQLRVDGDNAAVVLRELSLQSGAGRARVQVRADRRGAQYVLDGQGELKDFPLIFDDQLRALLTGRFELAGEVTSDQVFIRSLRVPELHVELPEVRRKDLQDLDRPSDIVLVRRGEPLYKRRAEASAEGGALAAVVPANTAQAGRRYLVLVHAPRNIWVRGTDVNAELGLSDDFRVEVNERTLMFGEVRFLRGRVDVLGRRFDVLRDSQVRFAGPPDVPYINLTAEHTNEREQVAVFTTVRGQGRELTVRVSSKPALSESEIYTLLATGRRTLKRGSGASMSGAEAASVVGSYGASQLKRMFASKLPIDVLSIEAGQQGLADASLEAGAYVSDKVYFGSVYRLGARPERNENPAGFRLEYQISPRWNFETEYGTARSGGADVMWSREY